MNTEKQLHCHVCKTYQDESEFTRDATRSSGRASKCKTCARKVFAVKQNERNAKTRATIQALKANPCADCGIVLAPERMDFDHRDRATKLFDISEFYGKSKIALKEELAKCDLVCKPCHNTRTLARKKAGDQHYLTPEQAYLAYLTEGKPEDIARRIGTTAKAIIRIKKTGRYFNHDLSTISMPGELTSSLSSIRQAMIEDQRTKAKADQQAWEDDLQSLFRK